MVEAAEHVPSPRHLRNAPLTEALIDIRVKARAGFQSEDFAALKERLAPRFPMVDERRGIQARFSVMEGQGQPAVVEDLGIQGFFFKTADQRTIAQFRVDGFTLNRLSPYTSWDDVFPLAMELWGIYFRMSMPEVVTRLAVRYINRLLLPSGQVPFEGYLRAGPVVPPELPQNVSGFLSRITIHNAETDIAANVAQALEESVQGDQSSVILDIDAYKQGEFPVDGPDVERTFAQLRDFKNLIFFNSLTEAFLAEFE